jgi:hypothetical protein
MEGGGFDLEQLGGTAFAGDFSPTPGQGFNDMAGLHFL